jgi:hypothetical protein
MDNTLKQRGHTPTMCRLVVLTAGLLICQLAHADDATPGHTFSRRIGISS